jgi:hypothetical protein
MDDDEEDDEEAIDEAIDEFDKFSLLPVDDPSRSIRFLAPLRLSVQEEVEKDVFMLLPWLRRLCCCCCLLRRLQKGREKAIGSRCFICFAN